MKIAIQGHPTRGKEVIQILESLGGINRYYLSGTCSTSFYYINKNNNIKDAFGESLYNHTLYTLEEFEKEFPFKIGDLCIYRSDIYDKEIVVKILGITVKNDYIVYEIDYKDSTRTHSGIYREKSLLKPYKEMKERNITLTLEKAKEWYQKGGELREVALQAFTEEELNPLPKSWEDYCKYNSTLTTSFSSCAKYDAFVKLEHLRDCWLGEWTPIWDISHKWCIRVCGNELSIGITTNISRFLTFPTKEMAEEFLECFRDLIELAKYLI